MKAEVMAAKREEEAAALGRVVEEEYEARRELNNAMIEFRRVEDVEAPLLEEERGASTEARVRWGAGRGGGGPRR